ncbi:MAG: TolC family protein [Pirellulaceae bacterium]
MRAWVVLLAVALLSGCSRAHYRNWADNDTYPILAERIVYPTYDIGRTRLEPAPESRLADPFSPDCPPKPPDDPAAALFMERPGGMPGAKHWEENGVTDQIEPAGWEIVLEPDAAGTIRLDQNKAVEVALLNSREYQTALENVYLVALFLTLNRFEFDLQWFLTNRTDFTHFGSGPNETNTLTSNSNLGFTRNFAAGGQLLVDFANSFVVEFTGGQQRWRSNLLVNLVQPLLRGAGRQVRLESLTQAERDVLYSVRDFARFRKRFWADVAIDNGGYLDLLLALQTVRNNQGNYKRQEETYRLYNELFLGGRASAVELDQFFLSLQAARLDVIQSETGLQNALDAFKLRIGIPPRVPIELDDALLDEFILVDPQLEQMRDELEAFQRARLAELDAPPTVEQLHEYFQTTRSFAERAPAALQMAEADLARWGERIERATSAATDADALDRSRRTYENLRSQVPGIARDMADALLAIDRHAREVTEATRQADWETLTTDIKLVLAGLDTIVAVQTQAKIHLIELPAVDISVEDALTEAKENRLDLQNELGRVTDAWRKVTVAANALQADLDVVARANLGTDPDRLNPLTFAAEASSYTLGLEFDGPLNRVAERNVYRASLINFQRARRSFMGLSDRIEFDVRRDLRQLGQLRVGFEISRQQLLSAARQFENARIILLGPRDRRSANDTTTLNLLQALRDLVNARNALAANYINYEQQRVQLLLDLETLQLDPRGFPLHDSLHQDGGPPAASDGTGEQPGAAEEIPPGQPRSGIPPVELAPFEFNPAGAGPLPPP